MRFILLFFMIFKNKMNIKKILVTGGTGLVGKGIESICNEYKDIEFIFLSSKDCNLLIKEETYKTFCKHQPDVIIHLAANVGGLFKNMNYKVQMFEENIIMNMNVLRSAHRCNIQRVISCLSTCIFPDKTTYPIDETMLHDGPPHSSNDAYAYAKRMLEIQSKAYQENYNRDYICVIPTNIYGPHDNFHLEDGHVIPSLIHQCYLSKKEGIPFVIKGSGKPLRQFIYNEDLARFILWVVLEYSERESIILSVGEEDEVSIRDVGRCIAREFEYEDHIIFDTSFSDGQYKKTANNKKLLSYLPNPQFTKMSDGIKKTVKWFNENYPKIRK